MAETSCCAWSRATPGLGRTNASIQRALRSSSWLPPLTNVSSIETGTQKLMAQPTKVPRNSSGATPTMVCGTLFSRCVLPMIAGSLWKPSRQS